jgi:hypothetical protein
MKQIMKRAWEIVRNAIAKFGGKCRDYMAEALRMAWAEVKNAKENIMKTNEMLNDYVMKNGVGGYGQKAFVEQFIEALGVDLDNRFILLESGEDSFKLRASFSDFQDFVIGQIMGKGFGCFAPFTEPFEVVETAQPKVKPCNFFDALESGRRAVEASEKWEGIY